MQHAEFSASTEHGAECRLPSGPWAASADSVLIAVSPWRSRSLCFVAGCGTTRMTDSRRTATEQLLISTAIDRAVDDIDCTPLAESPCSLPPTTTAPRKTSNT